MSSFEYVMVIVAIIMGLGITALLKGAVAAMRSDSPLVPGPLHSVWVMAILLQYVLLWSIRWNGARREDWPAIVLFLFLLLPILYFAQAELLFPRDGRETDLDDYFISNRRPFFLLAFFGYLSAALGPFIFYSGADPLAGGSATTALPTYAALGGASLVFVFVKQSRAHLVWGVIYAGLLARNLLVTGVG